MTGLDNEVVVVSAFGRGNWLAAELARKGVKNALVDVSKKFVGWSPEDRMGPFGFFQNETLTESQASQIQDESFLETVPEGFVVWAKDGVLDTTGPMAAELLKRWGVSEGQIEHLRRGSPSLVEDEFQKMWFVNLCHSLAGSRWVENRAAHHEGTPQPVFAPHFARRSSRRGAEQNLQWVKNWGSQVFSGAALVDVHGDRGQLTSLEIASEGSQVLRAGNFVFCLTQDELQFLSPKVSEKIFSEKPLRPVWQWQRFRLVIKGSELHREIPLRSVVIEDLHLPWTHENLLVLERTSTGEHYDVWMRLPATQRFQRHYLDEKGSFAARNLGRRLPGCEVEVVEGPPEQKYTAEDLGPARFPVYAAGDERATTTRAWDNVRLSSPETYSTYDLSGVFSEQLKLLNQILDWKRKRDEAAARVVQKAGAKS
jgi:hypothetical protein